MAAPELQYPTSLWLSIAPPTPLTRVFPVCSMASSAKRRAVGLGENPDESDNSSDENLEDDDDSGEEDSEASEEEINEVKEGTSLSVDAVHGLVIQLTQLSANRKTIILRGCQTELGRVAFPNYL